MARPGGRTWQLAAGGCQFGARKIRGLYARAWAKYFRKLSDELLAFILRAVMFGLRFRIKRRVAANVSHHLRIRLDYWAAATEKVDRLFEGKLGAHTLLLSSHLSMICAKSGLILLAIGRYRVFVSTFAAAVSQYQLVPSRTV